MKEVKHSLSPTTKLAIDNEIEQACLKTKTKNDKKWRERIEGMKRKIYKKGDFLEHRNTYNKVYNQALEDLLNKQT